MTTLAQSQDPKAFRAAIMAELLQLGIAEVTIEFDGSGDEGQISDICCTTVSGNASSLTFPSNIPGQTIAAGERIWDSTAYKYVTQTADRPATMREVLDAWCYGLLDHAGVDWVNNEGGYGEIVIKPAVNSVRCHMNARIIDSIYSEHEL
ncbi:hypothetical protein KBI52_02240 [Microvirga sp. HBU67558]|uniref:DUF6878 family protein n=1 Tax=Microvirga TaxID=186650 RepID=UPI001B39277A|nr:MULTISPECIES: DUF6878 family protein [unclassified Microvirga]MBQ0819069.1 hypothetical protein [Microvirga sp. HBU67558]